MGPLRGWRRRKYRADTRADAECEARWSVDDDVEWRVVEVTP